MSKYFVSIINERFVFDKGKTEIIYEPDSMICNFNGKHPSEKEIKEILNSGKKITFMQKLEED